MNKPQSAATNSFDRASFVALVGQVVLAFVACGLSFLIVDGSRNGFHIPAVLILTAVFTLAFVGFSAARAASGFALDSRDLAVVIFVSLAGAAAGVLLGAVLPRAWGLELGPTLLAALMLVLFNFASRVGRLELQRVRNERRP